MIERGLPASCYETLLAQIDLIPVQRKLLDSIPCVEFSTHTQVEAFKFKNHPEFNTITLSSRSSRISSINNAIAEITEHALINIGERNDPAYVNILISEYPLYKRLYKITTPFKWALPPKNSGSVSDQSWTRQRK